MRKRNFLIADVFDKDELLFSISCNYIVHLNNAIDIWGVQEGLNHTSNVVKSVISDRYNVILRENIEEKIK